MATPRPFPAALREFWQTRLQAWSGAALSPEMRQVFARELAETNRRRLSVLFPLVMVGHAIHIWIFSSSGAARAALDARTLRWHDGIAYAHLWTLLPLLVIGGAMFAGRRAPAARFIGPLAGVLYLVHGAAVSGIDQLVVTAITPFMGYSLGMAVILALTPRAALLIYGIGLCAFLAAIASMQPAASARLAIYPSGISTVLVSLTLSWLLYAARRRDFMQRLTIEDQGAALAALNAGLERRVAEQVAEIVARAEEVERLNAQLQAQVRERSTELALALAKLTPQHTGPAYLAPGLVLGGRFQVQGVLGEGGMGVVYAGLDRSTGARVAIKVVQASSSQLDSVQRFLREARAAATVTHRAIVRVLHVDVSDDGTLFQVQELVEGEVLQTRLRRGMRWDPNVVARLSATLFDALAAAHALGIVHRDVKPGNIMLTSAEPGLKLVDFGISKLHEDALAEEHATRTGTILGTPEYMAPEQIIATRDTTDRVDVYAAGVLMFQLLTARLPFEDGPTPRAIAHNHVASVPPDARALTPEVPDELAECVGLCLRKDPRARPSATELAARLRAFADACSTPALDELERGGALRDLDFGRAVSAPTVAARSLQPRA